MEIGIQNATECNTRHLLDKHNWAGYWIEASPAYVKEAKKRFQGSQVGILQEFVTAENIQPMLGKLQLPEDLDLLSIDIDGNDYWVWKAIKKRVLSAGVRNGRQHGLWEAGAAFEGRCDREFEHAGVAGMLSG
ncbi:MAG: hypothetical protein ACREA4_12250, partial [Nitrososphaera sp.]